MASGKAMWNRDDIYFGVTPALWWNDDFLDIDIGITFGQCVSEMALAGYDGCSVGHKFPIDIGELSRELELRRLRLSEPWTSLFFTCNEHARQDRCRLPEVAQRIHQGDKGAPTSWSQNSATRSIWRHRPYLPNRPISTDAQWDGLTHGLNELGQIAKDAGMRLGYHQHMGTGVRTLCGS